VDDEMSRIANAIRQLAIAMRRPRVHERILEDAGLSVDSTGLQLLAVLHRSCAPCRIGALAEALHIEAPHATRKVQRLESARLVQRVADPDDRRVSLITLTPSGRKMLDSYLAMLVTWLSEALSGWDRRELCELARLLTKMADDWSAFLADKATRG
jgi:DNA-binding MarR family transcriptional regulator